MKSKEEIMVYEIICSWCGKKIGTKEDAGSNLANKLKEMGLPIISNGICADCKEKVTKQYGLNKKGDHGND